MTFTFLTTGHDWHFSSYGSNVGNGARRKQVVTPPPTLRDQTLDATSASHSLNIRKLALSCNAEVATAGRGPMTQTTGQCCVADEWPQRASAHCSQQAVDAGNCKVHELTINPSQDFQHSVRMPVT